MACAIPSLSFFTPTFLTTKTYSIGEAGESTTTHVVATYGVSSVLRLYADTPSPSFVNRCHERHDYPQNNGEILSRGIKKC